VASPLTADLALALLAAGGAELGGAVVHAPGAEEAERWLAALRATRRQQRPHTPWRVVPASVTPDRLDGAVDVAATLAAGRTVGTPGLIAEAAGGVLVLPRPVSATLDTLARIAAALDDDGPTPEARAVVVAVVTGDDERESLPAVLGDRLALHVALPAAYEPDAWIPDAGVPNDDPCASGTAASHDVRDTAGALWQVADALGVGSPRAVLHALRTARALAGLAGRASPTPHDVADAVRLTLAPRATRLPADAPEPPHDSADAPAPSVARDEDDPPPPASAADTADAERAQDPETSGGADTADAPDHEAPDHDAPAPDVRELLIAAARTALPPGLLTAGPQPNAQAAAAARTAADGRRAAGARRPDERRGRLVGVRPAAPRGGRRLALVETLRAAVPWQRVRGRLPDGPLAVRAGDLRVERRQRPAGTTTIVLVDASGSAALGRLAEAKGAVELLLAESYARRDRVALVAFRGTRADVLLPPTRALARARRAVGGLPAGGGTPLAAALVTAAELAGAARREGARPAVVLLTDGRANVALDGTPGRARARDEAHGAARALAAVLARAGGLAIVVDTAARAGMVGDADAAQLARALGGRYVALPHVDARALHARVRAALGEGHAAGAPA